MTQSPRIAVLIPCYNEQLTIGQVVADFRRSLPQAAIFVYDNASSDETSARAREAGAILRREPRRGKGNVVRRMFADIEADIYILVDGDDTYDAADAPRLISTLLSDRLDMVTGKRVPVEKAAYRAGHVFGNRLFTGLAAAIFDMQTGDMLSGYRALSRRFVKSFPSASEDFGIETELTIHAVRLLMPVGEMESGYRGRPANSHSKLNTWRDGWRIFLQLGLLLRQERPMIFFASLFLLLAIASVATGTPVILDYLRTGLVPRLPTAVLAAALMLLACLSLASGIILDSVTRGRWEQKRLAYLALPGIGGDPAP